MENNKFTNKQELEYPTEEDFVDVKVLNNNTRLLSEQKADIADIEVSLQGVAKERTEYSIEDRIKNLEENIPKFYYDLYYNQVTKTPSSLNINQETLFSQVTGEGELTHCYIRISGTGSSAISTPTYRLKIVVDDEIKIFHKVHFSGSNPLSSVGFFSQINIVGYDSRNTNTTSSKRCYPFIHLNSIIKNGSSYPATNELLLAPRNYMMHPISSEEKLVYMNGMGNTEYCTQGTLELNPIKYKRKMQVYFTLLDRASINEIKFHMYYKPKS